MRKPDISLNIYHARVVAGACWLDAKLPGWEKKIDLGSLDLGNTCRCILGQLWGNYGDAVDSFLTEAPGGDKEQERAFTLASDWGFNLSDDEPDWSMLQEAWVYEILSRTERKS